MNFQFRFPRFTCNPLVLSSQVDVRNEIIQRVILQYKYWYYYYIVFIPGDVNTDVVKTDWLRSNVPVNISGHVIYSNNNMSLLKKITIIYQIKYF